MPEANLLFSSSTSGPIEVEIVNPRSVVQLGVLRPGDDEVGIRFLPTTEREAARKFAMGLVTAEVMNGSAFVMEGDRLTVTLPDVADSDRGTAGIQLYVPAGSKMTYRSDSGLLTYKGSWNPRDDWWLHRDEVPAPPLDLTYRADNGEAHIIGATGSVDAFDRAGHVELFLAGGVGVARTSTGSLRVSGSGTLSVHAQEPGSEILVVPPCDLDLTVGPGEGAARFGFGHETGVPLGTGTFHAAAPFTTSRPPEGGRVVNMPVLTVTPAKSSRRDASRTASAVLAGPAESGHATGQPAVRKERPARSGPSVPDRADGMRPPGA